MTKSQHLYVLRLRSGRYYIGISNDPWRRWLQHKKGTGAMVCRHDPPVEKVYLLDLRTHAEFVARLYENFVTMTWSLVLGCNNVIGGSYIDDQYRRASREWCEAEQKRLFNIMEASYFLSPNFPAMKEIPLPPGAEEFH